MGKVPRRGRGRKRQRQRRVGPIAPRATRADPFSEASSTIGSWVDEVDDVLTRVRGVAPRLIRDLKGYSSFSSAMDVNEVNIYLKRAVKILTDAVEHLDRAYEQVDDLKYEEGRR